MVILACLLNTITKEELMYVACGIPKKNRVHHTSDIIWLKQMYYNPQVGEYYMPYTYIIETGDSG